MTLDGAINLNETNTYVIYTMNSVATGQYGVVVPKNINGTMNMLIDLHMRSSFDAVGNGVKTKEQLVSEIVEEYNKLGSKYVDCMLVIPMIDEGLFTNIVNTGDKQKMFDEVKKIGAITSELYKKLTESGIEKHKIDQKIIIIEKVEEDIKFVSWLKEQMPNYVDGISYNDFNVTGAVDNPFVGGTDIFGTAVQTEVSNVSENVSTIPGVDVPPVSANIFDNTSSAMTDNSVVTQGAVVSPAVTEAVVPNVVVEPVISAPIVEQNVFENSANNTNSIFGTPSVETVQPDSTIPAVEVPAVALSVAPIVESAPVVPVAEAAPVVPNVETVVAPSVESVSNVVTSVPVQQMSGVFSEPVNASVQNVQSVNPTVANPIVNNVVQEQSTVVGTVEGPKPVEGAPLDSTMTFTTMAEQTNEDADNGENGGLGRKGFVNLAVLLVILVGVTFLSIQIGKYLYDVFGA